MSEETTALLEPGEDVEVQVDEGRDLYPHRRMFLIAAVARFAFGVAAIPLAAKLYEEQLVLVVLLRPTKEILLAAGYFVRLGDVDAVAVGMAALPLMVGGSWINYCLGLSYRHTLQERELPGIAGRVLPRERLHSLEELLRRGGPMVILLGRLAVFPSSLLAAAAGSSGMPRARFLVADFSGAIISIVLVVGAGYLLGEAYEKAGLPIAILGLVALFSMALLLGRQLQRWK